MSRQHNLVLQVNIDSGRRGDGMFSFVPDLYDYASRAAMEYSKRTGASYMVLREPVLDIYDYHPAWQRYVMFEEAFDIYDQILYLDADVVASGPDIFERYKSPGFHAVPVLDSDPDIGPGIKASILRQVALFGLDLASYFNSGVILVDKKTRQKIRALQWQARILDYNKEDQPTINKIVQDEIGLKKMDWRFNCLLKRQDQLVRAKQAFFVHFLGKELFRAVRPA
jgi:lipopolysaccharide biosynthesis glycosyltransferase